MRTKNIVGTILCTLGILAAFQGWWAAAIVLFLSGIVAFCWHSKKLENAVDVADVVGDIIDF